MANEPIFLYVEDDESSCEVMQMLLTYRLGYSNLTIYSDTTNFLSKLARVSPHPTVFFLDIHVKPHDGFEVLSMLRTHDSYKGAIVVAVTASVMNEEVEALQSAGFDGVISKPIDPDVFPDIVTAILAGKKIWQISS